MQRTPRGRAHAEERHGSARTAAWSNALRFAPIPRCAHASPYCAGLSTGGPLAMNRCTTQHQESVYKSSTYTCIKHPRCTPSTVVLVYT